jgi:hypothetical protein
LGGVLHGPAGRFHWRAQIIEEAGAAEDDKDQKKDAAQQEPDARADPLQDSDHDLPLVLPDLGETRGRGRVSNI